MRLAFLILILIFSCNFLFSKEEYNFEYQGYYEKLRDGKKVLKDERKIINSIMFDYCYYYTGEVFSVIKYEKNSKNYSISYYRKSGLEIGIGVFKDHKICDGLELQNFCKEDGIVLEEAKYYKDRKLCGQGIEFYLNNENIIKVRTIKNYENNVAVGLSISFNKITGKLTYVTYDNRKTNFFKIFNFSDDNLECTILTKNKYDVIIDSACIKLNSDIEYFAFAQLGKEKTLLRYALYKDYYLEELYKRNLIISNMKMPYEPIYLKDF